MSVQIVELEKLLGQIVAEHNMLLGGIEAHQDAMKQFRIDDVATCGKMIESSRTRMVLLEARRRMLVQQIVRINKLPADAALSDIAALVPQHKAALLKRREELKTLTALISRKTLVSSRVAGALLGHLNSVVRLVAGAVQSAAVYTKQGMPTVNARIGVMEAVG
ncbi:MAG TPA: hypothetical protein VGB55_03640 [Tepidisphaeraceae bacterium]|jgi:hypothetical protein